MIVLDAFRQIQLAVGARGTSDGRDVLRLDLDAIYEAAREVHLDSAPGDGSGRCKCRLEEPAVAASNG